jgi:hypothetical protein
MSSHINSSASPCRNPRASATDHLAPLGSSVAASPLLQRVRFELGLANTRDDRVGARVGDQQSALDGGVQRRAQDPVQRDGTLREPLGYPIQEIVDVAHRDP